MKFLLIMKYHLWHTHTHTCWEWRNIFPFHPHRKNDDDAFDVYTALWLYSTNRRAYIERSKNFKSNKSLYQLIIFFAKHIHKVDRRRRRRMMLLLLVVKIWCVEMINSWVCTNNFNDEHVNDVIYNVPSTFAKLLFSLSDN